MNPYFKAIWRFEKTPSPFRDLLEMGISVASMFATSEFYRRWYVFQLELEITRLPLVSFNVAFAASLNDGFRFR